MIRVYNTDSNITNFQQTHEIHGVILTELGAITKLIARQNLYIEQLLLYRRNKKRFSLAPQIQ